jgi:TRAP-type transport system periplasmic protein
MMKRVVFLITMLSLTLMRSSVCAQGVSYRDEYRLSTVLGSSFPWGQAGERWAELVRDKTQGRINIRLYPKASLVGGDQTREFTAIKQGVIDLAIGSTINWSPQIKELNIFSLPFLIPDYRGIDALTRGEVGLELFRILERNDVIPLAWGENGFRELSNSKRPINWPTDLKGLRFRVVGSSIFAETFSMLGAKPTLMSWTDAQPALAAGTVDGQENPATVFAAARMHTLNQKYLTLWHYTADPLIFVVNKTVWESWTAADRRAVQLAALEAGLENIAIARRGISGGDHALFTQLERLGVNVVHLSPEQRAAFVVATRAVYERWTKVIGSALVKKAEMAILEKR